MDSHIGIVGAGTAGLHLGLFLRRNNVSATIYTAQSPEAIRRGKLLNTVAHHHVTIERERALGINHWPEDEYGYTGHHYYVGGEEPIAFHGRYQAASRAVDYRIYHPQLMQDFLEAGGEIVYREMDQEGLLALQRKHRLVVASSGKGACSNLFKRNTQESPSDRPLRLLCAGLFKGIKPREEPSVTMYFSPGHGEIIEIPTLSFDGMCTALVIENVPGGDLEVLSRQQYKADPRAFLDLLMLKFETHYPTLLERIDPAEFDLAHGPLDLLQGGFSPTVRASHIVTEVGGLVPAIGDIHALVDPMTGQGANMASHSAWVLGEEILAHDVYDERFMETVDRRRSDRILCASRWTNYLLGNLVDPPSQLVDVFKGMREYPEMANEFTENFNYPERQWDRFASQERLAAWLEQAASNSRVRDAEGNPVAAVCGGV